MCIGDGERGEGGEGEADILVVTDGSRHLYFWVVGNSKCLVRVNFLINLYLQSSNSLIFVDGQKESPLLRRKVSSILSMWVDRFKMFMVCVCFVSVVGCFCWGEVSCGEDLLFSLSPSFFSLILAFLFWPTGLKNCVIFVILGFWRM